MLQRLWRAGAGLAGTAVRGVRSFGLGLLGLGLVSYGAWLAWQPAGFLTAGALLLADQIADRRAR